jgi:hypothetical protein
MQDWPAGVDRVRALVEAYFPRLSASDFKRAALAMQDFFIGERKKVLDGTHKSLDTAAYGPIYETYIAAAGALRGKVIEQMHSGTT